jgi:hypothetical protein
MLLLGCNDTEKPHPSSETSQANPVVEQTPIFWIRHDSDSQEEDKDSGRTVLFGHPWVRIGPELYDGREDADAKITIDFKKRAVMGTSGRVTHRVVERSLEELLGGAERLEKIIVDAKAYRDRAVLINCHWINHGEGAWLAAGTKDPLDLTLSIGSTATCWFVEADGTELQGSWDLGSTRRVVVYGTMRIGDFNAGMIELENHPFIEPEVVIAIGPEQAANEVFLPVLVQLLDGQSRSPISGVEVRLECAGTYREQHLDPLLQTKILPESLNKTYVTNAEGVAVVFCLGGRLTTTPEGETEYSKSMSGTIVVEYEGREIYRSDLEDWAEENNYRADTNTVPWIVVSPPAATQHR